MVRNTTPNRALNGLHALSYLGVNPTTPPDFYSIDRDPTPADWSNFALCDMWLNTITEDVWILVRVQAHQAKWVKFAGGSGDVITITGNTGGAVPSDVAGNINVVGDAVGITITGVPGTNTLTASLIGGGQAIQGLQPQLLGVNVGIPVTPTAGIIDINNTDGNILFTNGGGNLFNTRFANSIVVNNNYTGLNGVVLVVNDGTIPAAPRSLITANQQSVNTDSGVIQTLKQRGSGAIVSGDEVGIFAMYGYDGTNFVQTAKIQSLSSGTVAANRVAGNLEFFTHPDSATGLTATQRMVISSAGNVTIPQADSGLDLVVDHTIQINNGVLSVNNNGTSATPVGLVGVNQTSNNSGGGFIQVSKQHGVGNPIVSGDTAGNFAIYGYDGTNFVETARIASITSGTVAANRVAGNLSFYTHPDSTSGGLGSTQRFVISSAGNVTILAPDSGVALTSIATFGQVVGGSGIAVVVDNAGLFGTVVSSAKFKENIEDMADYSDSILDLRPVTFNYKQDSPDVLSVGLIAEEVADIFPNLAVSNAQGEITTVKYLDLIPMLLNELQKLNARVEVLEDLIQNS